MFSYFGVCHRSCVKTFTGNTFILMYSYPPTRPPLPFCVRIHKHIQQLFDIYRVQEKEIDIVRSSIGDITWDIDLCLRCLISCKRFLDLTGRDCFYIFFFIVFTWCLFQNQHVIEGHSYKTMLRLWLLLSLCLLITLW